MTDYNRQNTELLKDIIRNPYCWPGGYERYAITSDGGILCQVCLKDEYQNILHSTRYSYNDGWQIAGQTNDSEIESFTTCDHCGRVLYDDMIEYTLPSYWASYLINGDASGLDDDEYKTIQRFEKDVIAEHGNANFMDCTDEPEFLKYHDVNYLGVLASDCLTYKISPNEV